MASETMREHRGAPAEYDGPRLAGTVMAMPREQTRGRGRNPAGENPSGLR
jgi:hypothetical protein